VGRTSVLLTDDVDDPIGSGYLGLKFLVQDGLRNSADLFIDDLPRLEHQQGGDASNPKARRYGRVFIYV
jgi:hypothetical protein